MGECLIITAGTWSVVLSYPTTWQQTVGSRTATRMRLRAVHWRKFPAQRSLLPCPAGQYVVIDRTNAETVTIGTTAAARPKASPPRTKNDRQGPGFDRPSHIGAYHPDSSLQSLVHVLQRVRRFLETRADGQNEATDRPSGTAGHIHH